MKRKIILLFVVLLGLSWYTTISEIVSRPGKVKACMQRAAELEEKEIYVDAITAYEQAAEYDSQDPGIYRKMAKAYLNSDNPNKFISICEDTAETFQDTETIDMLMEYYLDNDYEDRAVKYIMDYLETYPEDQTAQKWYQELRGSYRELYCYYEEMSGMVNDFMIVQKDGLYGITDATGHEVIAEEYQELHPFSEEGFAAAVKEDGQCIYIDQDGQTRKVPDVGYKNPGMLSEERATALKDGRYGYLDEEMEPVGKFTWDELTALKHDTGAGKKDGKWMLVNQKGKAKGEKSYDDIIVDENGFCSYQERIFVKEGKQYHLIDTKGKEIGKLKVEDARAFGEDGYAAVCKDGKWGFMDTDGELVIDCRYEDAQSFQNGLAAVCMDGLWGYVDEDGNLVVDAQFVQATGFSSLGTAAVKMKTDDEEVWKLIQLNIFV